MDTEQQYAWACQRMVCNNYHQIGNFDGTISYDQPWFFGDVHKAIWVIQTRGTDGGKPGKSQSFSDTYAKITALHGVVSGLLKGKAHQPLRK
jgi:predicted porin